MTYAFISAVKATFPVAVLCKVLQVSRSGFYPWCERGASIHAQEDEKLKARIAAIHERSNGLYGSPKVLRDLRTEGISVSRKRVARLMKSSGCGAKATPIQGYDGEDSRRRAGWGHHINGTA